MFKSFTRKITGLLIPLAALGSGLASAQQDPDTAAAGQGTVTAPAGLDQLLDSEDFNLILDRAAAFQLKADELERTVIQWRKEASGMDDPADRGRLQKRIVVLEDSVDIYTGLANEQFMILDERLPGGREGGNTHPFLVRDTVLHGITVYHYRLNGEFRERLEEIRNEIPERDAGESREGGEKGRERSPYDQVGPFEENFALPAGVFYRIQIAVFRNRPPADQFGGLSPITTEPVPGQDLTRYFAGKFTRMEDAEAALDKVRSLGYHDAFIIGYYDGKKSTFSKLKALEE